MRGGGILSEATERLEVEVEDQNFRFQSKERPTHDEALTLTGAKRVGDHVILERKRPHATLVFEESGTILVHGLARPEVAKLAVRETLLQLGLPEEGLTMEAGPVLARFTTGKAIISSVATSRLTEATLNEEVGAVEIAATRFGGVILIFPSGKGLALGMRSRRIAQLAIETYLEILEQEGALA